MVLFKASSSSSLLIIICFIIMAIVLHSSSAQNSEQDYLDAHNLARSQVGIADIAWDSTLEAYAQSYANQRINDCNLVHSGWQYGENLVEGTSITGTYAVNMWVAEEANYDYNSDTCAAGEVCGHYTQVVWRDSVWLGCARVQCTNNGKYFVICSYDPPGNYNGQKTY